MILLIGQALGRIREVRSYGRDVFSSLHPQMASPTTGGGGGENEKIARPAAEISM